MSQPAPVLRRSPSGEHVEVQCPCGRKHWTGREQDVMCHQCGRVLTPANATLAAPTALWDEHGTPLQPHVACPSCLEDDEVGSHFDSAWCYFCGWRGSLTEQHARAAATGQDVPPSLVMTVVEVLVDRPPVDDRVLPAATFVVRQFSCGYVETAEDATMVPTSLADFDLEVQ